MENYDFDHGLITEMKKYMAPELPPRPAPRTIYQRLTNDKSIKRLAANNSEIHRALQELEVLIKLHENIDTD